MAVFFLSRDRAARAAMDIAGAGTQRMHRPALSLRHGQRFAEILVIGFYLLVAARAGLLVAYDNDFAVLAFYRHGQKYP
jgi:hypothetical protein